MSPSFYNTKNSPALFSRAVFSFTKQTQECQSGIIRL